MSDRGKGKSKAELVDLCKKASEIKQANLEETVKDYNKLLEEKLQMKDGKLPDPKTLTAWTKNFLDIWSLHLEICTVIWWEERSTLRQNFFLLKVSWAISCFMMAILQI